MRDFTLSEHTKDTILNVLLVFSIMLFIASFAHKPQIKKETNPIRSSYVNYQIQPVSTKEYPVYSALTTALPVTSNQVQSAKEVVAMTTKSDPSTASSIVNKQPTVPAPDSIKKDSHNLVRTLQQLPVLRLL